MQRIGREKERERIYVYVKYPANMMKHNIKYGFVEDFEIDTIK